MGGGCLLGWDGEEWMGKEFVDGAKVGRELWQLHERCLDLDL